MRASLRALSLLAVLLSLAPVAAAQEAGRYYSETGHTLDGRFVEYFDDHGGLAILGFPVTDTFLDPQSGFWVQYTQNARLEYLPETEDRPAQARLSPLGELLGGWQAPLERGQLPVGAEAGCVFYEESGHNVCHAFLEYYLNNGGPALFGYPISEFQLVNNRIVQYFQGYRLDWYPESFYGRTIRLAPLGLEHFIREGYPRHLLDPQLPARMDDYEVIDLQPSASLRHPIASTASTQELFMIVRDQNLMPVEGAAVTLYATLADGEHTILMPVTDKYGVSRFELPLGTQPPGTVVELEYDVVLGPFQATARDVFWVWW